MNLDFSKTHFKVLSKNMFEIVFKDSGTVSHRVQFMFKKIIIINNFSKRPQFAAKGRFAILFAHALLSAPTVF